MKYKNRNKKNQENSFQAKELSIQCDLKMMDDHLNNMIKQQSWWWAQTLAWDCRHKANMHNI